MNDDVVRYGGGLTNGHSHMATVSYPIVKGPGTNGTCIACVIINNFLKDAQRDGIVMAVERDGVLVKARCTIEPDLPEVGRLTADLGKVNIS